MRVDVIMPQMGESIAEGTLTRWLKKPGEKVARDEPIFEISTDKVDAEIPAPAAGVLAEVKVQEGETVPVNTIVAMIETEAPASASASAPRPAASPAPPAAASSAPAPASKSAPPAARPAPAAPAARSIPAAGGEPPRASALAASGATVDDLRRVRSSPLVRKIAREHNLDVGQIEGTGLGGRVTKKDILAALESGGSRPAAGARPAPASAAQASKAAPAAALMPPGSDNRSSR